MGAVERGLVTEESSGWVVMLKEVVRGGVTPKNNVKEPITWRRGGQENSHLKMGTAEGQTERCVWKSVR